MSNPRIISGTAGGLKIQPVPGNTTRPITDKVKEALFNIVGNKIFNASMLDLFGGTGSVGIEALSRGASYVRFVDNNKRAISTIVANLVHTKLEKNAQVIHHNAFKYLRQDVDRQFTFIYIAPPQFKKMWVEAILLLDNNSGWLESEGWVIIQISPVEYFPLNLVNFIEFRQNKYGSTSLVFYKKSD